MSAACQRRVVTIPQLIQIPYPPLSVIWSLSLLFRVWKDKYLEGHIESKGRLENLVQRNSRRRSEIDESSVILLSLRLVSQTS